MHRKNFSSGLILIGIFTIFNLLIMAVYGGNKQGQEDPQSQENSETVELQILSAEYKLCREAWIAGIAMHNSTLRQHALVNTALNDSNFPILVLRIDPRYCDACVDEALFYLKEYLRLYDKNKILVIVGSSENQNLYIKQKQLILPEIQFLSIPHDKERKAMDLFGKPYFFVLDRNGLMSQAYLPHPIQEKYSSEYLQIIAKQLNTD